MAACLSAIPPTLLARVLAEISPSAVLAAPGAFPAASHAAVVIRLLLGSAFSRSSILGVRGVDSGRRGRVQGRRKRRVNGEEKSRRVPFFFFSPLRVSLCRNFFWLVFFGILRVFFSSFVFKFFFFFPPSSFLPPRSSPSTLLFSSLSFSFSTVEVLPVKQARFFQLIFLRPGSRPGMPVWFL